MNIKKEKEKKLESEFKTDFIIVENERNKKTHEARRLQQQYKPPYANKLSRNTKTWRQNEYDT